MIGVQLFLLVLGVLFCGIYWFAVIGLVVHAILTLYTINQTTEPRVICCIYAIVSLVGAIIMAMLFIGFVYLITHAGPSCC